MRKLAPLGRASRTGGGPAALAARVIAGVPDDNASAESPFSGSEPYVFANESPTRVTGGLLDGAHKQAGTAHAQPITP